MVEGLADELGIERRGPQRWISKLKTEGADLLPAQAPMSLPVRGQVQGIASLAIAQRPSRALVPSLRSRVPARVLTYSALCS
jgi:hypothetical protein